MYVSGSADWAKQKNPKEKGHCFILMSNAPFYGLIRLSYADITNSDLSKIYNNIVV